MFGDEQVSKSKALIDLLFYIVKSQRQGLSKNTELAPI